MKCLLNYFAMNRQSGEKGKEEAGRNKKRSEEGERARGKRWKKRERAVASTVGVRVRDTTVTAAVIEKSTGWDSVKHWNWYGTRDIGHGNGHGLGHDYDQGLGHWQ